MFKIKRRKVINLFVQLALILLITIILSITPDNNKFTVKLGDCVDGDTAKFITDSGIETVRFLAIDTPESVHPTKAIEPFGLESSTYTCNELKGAKEIVLELDNDSDKYDKYKRLLAWVFVDDVLLQEKIIGKGYAKVAYLYGDYKYTNILLKEEAKAKENNLGIWYNK